MDSTSTAWTDGGDSDPSAPIPGPGDVIADKYLVTRVLGEGGMGVVLEAMQTRLRRRVALKFLRPDVLAMPDAIERFEREARATGRIAGPHVARVLDVDTTTSGVPYMVMELLEGRDLEAELRARGALPVSEAVDLALQACAALSAAHAAGVVHRDLKPSNLFVCTENGRKVVKLLDFGIAKLAGDSDPSVTASFATVGTPLYMSPEQVRSAADVDARTDVWSLGVILFEMIAGEPPFHGTTTAAIAAIVADAVPSLRELRRDVPAGLERVIRTALAKDPQGRFPTVDALAAALAPFASAEGLSGPFTYRPSQAAIRVARSALERPVPRAQETSASSSLRPLALSCADLRAARGARAAFAGCAFVLIVAASALTLVRARASEEAGKPPSSAAAAPLRTLAEHAASAASSAIDRGDVAVAPLSTAATPHATPPRHLPRATSLKRAAAAAPPKSFPSIAPPHGVKRHTFEHPLYL